MTGHQELVTGEPMQGKGGDCGDCRDHCKEHDSDEQGGTVRSLGCGLGDAEGIDESVCEIAKQFHGLRWQVRVNDRKEWLFGCAVKMAASVVPRLHLLLEYACCVFKWALAAAVVGDYTI